jgi:cystathionine beta-lyase/cystathionine gamma-synthase
VGGSLATHDEQLLERFRLIRKTTGCIQSPQDAWLTLRGIKTLPVRLKLHSENAGIVAQWLESHPAVERVYYPGLASFPQRALAERQHLAHGGMLAFEITAGAEAAIELMNSVRLCSLAENLGAVETLITHPASMTHGDVPVATRKAIGITDGLIRLSVGLESPEDIIADLEQALAVATEKAGRASCIVTR